MADVKLEGAVSTIPTQYAISILKNSNQDLGRQIVNSGEKVEKIAPLLVVGAVMALEGVRRSQGGQGSLFSPIMNIGAGLFNAGEALGHLTLGDTDAAREPFVETKNDCWWTWGTSRIYAGSNKWYSRCWC